MSLSVQITLLRRVPLFANARDEELAALLVAGEVVSFAPEHIICQADAPAGGAFLILSGMAEQIEGHNGAAKVLRELGPATLIGEMALFIDAKFNVTVRARTDVETLFLTRERFARALTGFPDVARACVEHIGGRLQAMTNELQQVQQRLAGPTVRATLNPTLSSSASPGSPPQARH